jgi:hypothetical protein
VNIATPSAGTPSIAELSIGDPSGIKPGYDTFETMRGVGDASAKSSGWMDIFKSKEGLNGLMQIGGGALKGLGDSQQNDLAADKFAWQQQVYNQQQGNANAVPNLGGMIQAVPGQVFRAPGVVTAPRVVYRPR